VSGVDLAPAALVLAARLSDGAAPGVLAFESADGHALPFDDGAFDAAACVGVLAFCDDPRRVLAELRRVLRPGGRLLAASSDEDTRVYNGHDRALGRRVLRALADRGRDPWLGRRLAHLLEGAGFRLREEAVGAEVERHFRPGTSGYILAHACRDYLLTRGGVAAADYARWLADLRACEWEGAYSYGVTTYAYLAERPPETCDRCPSTACRRGRGAPNCANKIGTKARSASGWGVPPPAAPLARRPPRGTRSWPPRGRWGSAPWTRRRAWPARSARPCGPG
jgi:SAM-dependent methyltransferase